MPALVFPPPVHTGGRGGAHAHGHTHFSLFTQVIFEVCEGRYRGRGGMFFVRECRILIFETLQDNGRPF